MECTDLLTSEEKKLVGQLRQRIEKELPQSILANSDEEDVDLYLVRWLRGFQKKFLLNFYWIISK